ncbi:TNF receptor-associated factor 6-B [Dermacentor silvarum]|uniref:TNF receptor-associated factor 6-B n=1 Tax=Dermacentor silvarum TaxID=543639 RepID=UPI00210162AC|nr:TNF receptor-associated factor 6-B [Dermacentor silvarum]
MTISPEQSALSTTASANDKGALPLRLNISGHSSQRIGCNTAMLPGSPQYTLVGFSDVLDWKPLLFVKPIPPNRVCALCGLIRPVSVLLLCGHVFCDCCSEQGVVDDDHHCPLDGGRCTKDDVEWRRFPAANLLQRDVYCWNKRSGCAAVMPASDVYKHFLNECTHHSTFCTRCSNAVLYSSIYAHVISHCRTLAISSAPENPQGSIQRDQTTTTGATTQCAEKCAAEINVALHSILSESNAQSNALNDLSQKMNIVINVVTEESRVVATRTNECLERNAAQFSGINESVEQCLAASNSCLEQISGMLAVLKNTMSKVELAAQREHGVVAKAAAQIGAMQMEVNESSQEILRVTERMLAHSSILLNFYTFNVQGVSALKRDALDEGETTFECDKVYLRGYYMSPGVCLRKQNDSLSLHIVIFLHKGVLDDFVEWPFHNTVQLSVIHPISGLRREICCKFSKENLPFLQKPVESSNSEVFSKQASLSLSDLEQDGYVLDDKLQCRWDIL